MTKTVNRELINYKTSAPTFRSGLKYRSENYETLFFSFNHDYARLSITCRDS